MFFRRSFVLLCFVLIVAVSAQKKEKRRKKQDKIDDAINKLTERIEMLETGKNVHFFFHADGEDHDHDHTDGDQHVHIDIHIDRHHGGSGGEHFHHEHVAVCNMNAPGVEGSVVIVQADNERSANFKFQFKDLGKRNTDHPIHVHQYGEIVGNCDDIGGHYDPYHEGIDVGDLGKLSTNRNGGVDETWNNDTHLTLFGEYSIVGRSIKVHGDDGKGLACCIIGWSPETHDHDEGHNHDHGHGSHDHDDHDHDHTDHDHDHAGHGHNHAGHDHDHHH